MAADTIVARSSAPGKAGVAVLRLSGPSSAGVGRGLLGDLPPPRQAALRLLAHDGKAIDRALVLWFPAPASFTGEDCLELHCHGSVAVVARLLEVTQKLGARLAEPGEFTRRAFTNGKMDLTAAEGLEDLIEAETEAQRAQALAVADGAIRETYHTWKDALLELSAAAEAAIDFPEDDLPADMQSGIARRRSELLTAFDSHLARGERAERLRSGVRVALVGPPNAGKSTLLNWLAQRDVAIVSEIAGTTRDRLEVNLDLSGYPVIVTDTAGIRSETVDSIERQGIERSRQAARDADLTIWVSEHGERPSDIVPDLIVRSKSDLVVASASDLSISVTSGAGLDDLLAVLTAQVKLLAEQGAGDAVSGRERHRQAIERMRLLLLRSEQAPLPELAAEDLRAALDELGRLLGTVDVEELLDHLFSGFCIGK